jgi:hypothetical protein
MEYNIVAGKIWHQNAQHGVNMKAEKSTRSLQRRPDADRHLVVLEISKSGPTGPLCKDFGLRVIQ